MPTYDVTYSYGANVNKFIADVNRAKASQQSFDNSIKRGATQASTSAQAMATRLSRNLQTIGGNLKKSGQAMEKFGRDMVAVSLVAGIALFGVLKIGSDMEKQFANVAKTVGGNVGVTQAKLVQLKKELIDLSRTIPIPFEKLSEYATMAGQMGIPINAIKAFTKTFAMLEVATDLAGEAGAKMIAQYMNIMKIDLNEKNFTKFGDTLVHLGNNLAATEKDILTMAQRMAPVGKMMDLTSDQVLALAGALSAMGAKPQFAAGAFQRLSRTISLAVADGGDQVKKFAKISGMSADEFTKSWKEKPLEALEAFSKGLKKNSKDQSEAFAIMKDLKIMNTQDARLLLTMAQNWEKIDYAMQLTTQSAKAMYNEFAQKNDTVSARLSQTKNIIMSIANSIFEKIAPDLKKALDTINLALIDFDERVRETPKWIIKLVLGFLTFLTALAPVAFVVGKIVTGIGTMIEALGVITGALGGSSVGAGIFTNALKMIPQVLSKLTGSIGIVISAVVLLYTKFESFRDLIHTVLKAIADIFISAFKLIATEITSVMSSLDELGASFDGVLEIVRPLVDGLVSVLKPALLAVITLIKGGLMVTIGNLFRGIKNIIAVVKLVADVFKAVFSGDIDGVIKAFQTFAQAIFKNTVDFIVNVLNSMGIDAQGVFENIKNFIMSVVNTITGAFNTVTTTVGAALTAISTTFSGVFNAIKGVVTNIVYFIVGLFVILIEGGMAIIRPFVNFFIMIFNAVKTAVTPIINGLAILFQIAVNNIMNFFRPLIAFFTNLFNGIKIIVNGVINIVTKNFTKVSNGAKTAMNIVKSIFTMTFNGIKIVATVAINAISTAISAVGKAASGPLNALKNAFTSAFNGIKSFVEGIMNSIGNLISSVIDKGKNALASLNPFKSDFVSNQMLSFVPISNASPAGSTTVTHVHNYNITTHEKMTSSSIMKLKQRREVFQ